VFFGTFSAGGWMSGIETLPRTDVPAAPGPSRRVRAAWLDPVIALGLAGVAFVVRLHIPEDGLFHDDAWQAFGAWKGSLSNLVTVGMTQPGFTAGLMVWTRLFGVSSAALVTPALIAGTLGPPALYLGLRRFGYARSVALLVGAALSSTRLHIINSYHVKTYTFDVLVILGLALVVWRLARRRWQPATAAVWFIASVAVGWFSSIALIASAVAGAILVLHASDDRKLRLMAVSAQLAALATIFLASSRTYSSDALLAFWKVGDAFIDFDANPLTFSREVFDHFWNVVDVFPGGPSPTLSLALAAVGLSVAAWRGPIVVPARFFALLVAVTVAASIVGRVPFGPPSALGRVSLWLVPVTALGLCTTFELLRRRTVDRAPLRIGFDVLACGAAALVLVGALGTNPGYPPGGRSAIRHAMANIARDDAVIITSPTTYPFALYADTPVSLRPTPHRQIGFLPEFDDDRLHPHSSTTSDEELDEFVEGAERVYLVHANVAPRGFAEYRFRLALELAERGLSRESAIVVGTGHVETWVRDTPTSTPNAAG
jgi:hypothetical protein